VHGLAAELFLLPPAVVVAGQEMIDQKGDVLLPLPEGGQANIDDFEAIIEIFPEFILADQGGKIAIRRRQDADVGLNGPDPADAGDFTVLDGPEDLGLGRQGHIADFVEEDAAAAGQFEFTLFLLDRPGEGPLLMTEKLTLHKALRDGGAIDNDKRFHFPGAVEVDRPGDDFLPRPRFSLDQHGGIVLADGLNRIEHRRQGRAFANQAQAAEFSKDFSPFRLQFFFAQQEGRRIEVLFRRPGKAGEGLQVKADFGDRRLLGTQKPGRRDLQERRRDGTRLSEEKPDRLHLRGSGGRGNKIMGLRRCMGRHDLPAMAEHVEVEGLIIRGIGDVDEENLDLSGNLNGDRDRGDGRTGGGSSSDSRGVAFIATASAVVTVASA